MLLEKKLRFLGPEILFGQKLNRLEVIQLANFHS